MKLPKVVLRLIDKIEARVVKREPDLYIGGKEDPYLIRRYVIPRNKWFNVYYHIFYRSDDDRALHDHPWLWNLSILHKGKLFEHTTEGVQELQQGQVKFRWGKAPHRLEVSPDYHTATLFITGPIVREWGFYCPKGWVHWKTFSSPFDKGQVGRGCD